MEELIGQADVVCQEMMSQADVVCVDLKIRNMVTRSIHSDYRRCKILGVPPM